MTSPHAVQGKKIRDSLQMSLALSIRKATFNQLSFLPLGFLPNSIQGPMVSRIICFFLLLYSMVVRAEFAAEPALAPGLLSNLHLTSNCIKIILWRDMCFLLLKREISKVSLAEL